MALKPSPATLILILIMLPFLPIVVKLLAGFFASLASTISTSIVTTGQQAIDTPILIGKYLLMYLFEALSNESVLYILIALGVIYAAAETSRR